MLKKNIYHKFNYIHVFIISLTACCIFYFLEGLIGIERFYHPDSKHYLSKHHFVVPFIEGIKKNPAEYTLSFGYYYLVKLLNYNYFYIIVTNFIFFSLCNVLIFEKIFKKLISNYNFTKLSLLGLILFFDPFRLHLACHVLKETILIQVFIVLMLSNSKIIKLFFLVLLEFIRKNSLFYLMIFITFSNLKKIINFNKKFKLKFSRSYKIEYLKYSIFFLSIFFIFISYDFILDKFSYLIKTLHGWHFTEMPVRDYDNISNFQNYNFALGFILKNFSWPFMFLTGTFSLFTSSFLFQVLGFIILSYHLIVYYITKKTFISFGLVLFVILISMYTTSYTPMFRYSYLGFYFSLIYFFYGLEDNE